MPNKPSASATASQPPDVLVNNTQVSFGGGVDGRMLIHERKYGVKEASKLLGLSESGLRLVISKGGIPVLRIGSKMMLLERDIEDFLRSSLVVYQQAENPIKTSSRLPKHFAESDLIHPKRRSA